MKCTGCGGELTAELRFCTTCGAPVRRTCPSCGADHGPDARFCGQCGITLGVTASPARGPDRRVDSATGSVPVDPDGPSPSAPASASRERKVATLLFADLVGFTELGESTDPEHVQSLVSRAFARLSVEVDRYEGIVEKFAGDAMLAVFGVPAVHEDDPERAVRAALEMQRAMGQLGEELVAEGMEPLQLRIGVETGDVLVDQARAATERDRMVTGDPVNTAARLQQSADPGEVVVGAGTYAATRELVRYEELAPLDLKGKGSATVAWRAVTVAERRGRVRVSRGLEAPLVGRDAELSLLTDAVQRTATDGRPHLITLFGDAGTGKSRLVWELEKYLDGLPTTWHWRSGQALAYGQPTFGPLAEVVRSDAGISYDDDPASAISKLTARVEDLGGGTSQRDALARLVHGGDDEAQSGERGQLFASWQRHLELLAERAPLVLVIEDLHWADDGTLDFIESLARWGGGPITVIVTTRHELADRRPTWGGGIANAASVVLEPLAADGARRFLDHLLDGEVPASVRDRIVAMGEGNPLFLEEVVRTLLDRAVLTRTSGRLQLSGDVEHVEVPDSVQALLAARLDALPEQDKAIVQAAAVVGRTFWVSAVAALTGLPEQEAADALRRLRGRELVVAVAEPSLAGEEELRFRHGLIRDVAYEALPMGERASRHARVVTWAQRRLGDGGEEVIELLAEHLLDAVRYALRAPSTAVDVDVDALRHDALVATHRAGLRALRLWDTGAASRWLFEAASLASALELPPREQATFLADYVDAADTHDPLEQVLEATERGLDLCLQDGAPASVTEARLRSRRADRLLNAGDVAAARVALEEGLTRVDEQDPAARAILLRTLGWLTWRTGEPADAVEILEDALADARAAGNPEVERWALHDLGIALAFADEHEAGIVSAQQSLQLAEEAGDHRLLSRCHINVPALLWDVGRIDEAVSFLHTGLEAARRALSHDRVAWLAANAAEFEVMGHARFALGEELLQESLAACEVIDLPVRASQTLLMLASFRLHQGSDEEAREALDRATGLGRGEENQDVLMAPTLDAMLRWRAGDPGGAIEQMDVALEAHGQRARRELSWWHVWHARMLARAGASEASSSLAEAVRAQSGSHGGLLFTEMEEWILVVLSGAAAPDAVERLLALTTRFEQYGHRLACPEVLADAALVAARAGRADAPDLVDRARAAFAELGSEPLFGPLPEPTWSNAPS